MYFEEQAITVLIVIPMRLNQIQNFLFFSVKAMYVGLSPFGKKASELSLVL